MESDLEILLASFGSEKRPHYALDGIKGALHELGNPEKNVYTLVIAGTNGKGTTALLVSSSLKDGGFKVGTYLSPHLQHPTERLLLGLVPIAEAELLSLAKEYLPLARKHHLTYFEFLTLLCFVWASKQSLDFLVLEVGLGGRLDATNVTEPLACAISQIGFDHEELLGHSLEEILDEKLGILKPEGLLFTSVREPFLKKRVQERCDAIDAIYYFSSEIRSQVLDKNVRGQSVLLNDYPFYLNNPTHGALENAELAFHLLRIIFPKLSLSALQRGFASVLNPGRFEVISEKPTVILSGDHNPAGIECLISTLKDMGIQRPKFVCAFSPDKPFGSMFERLRTVSGEILLTQASRFSRELPETYAKLGPFHANAEEAVLLMLNRCAKADVLVVTGSLYLVGEVRKIWHAEARFQKDSDTVHEQNTKAWGVANRPKAHSAGLIQTLV